MVKGASSLYLVLGQDIQSKNQAIAKIKETFLPKGLEDFNFDRVYAKKLALQDFQERILSLPVGVKKRIILIRGAEELSPDIKKFILEYLHKPQEAIVLILDVDKVPLRDEFLGHIARYTGVALKQEPRLDTFTLSRQIELRKPQAALLVLHQLFNRGERPERILGGLRYVLESRPGHPNSMREKLKLLLTCDIDMKTGKLKPDFALEKLIINLCCR
jgi:DNA polymerase III delta subunit